MPGVADEAWDGHSVPCRYISPRSASDTTSVSPTTK